MMITFMIRVQPPWSLPGLLRELQKELHPTQRLVSCKRHAIRPIFWTRVPRESTDAQVQAAPLPNGHNQGSGGSNRSLPLGTALHANTCPSHTHTAECWWRCAAGCCVAACYFPCLRVSSSCCLRCSVYAVTYKQSLHAQQAAEQLQRRRNAKHMYHRAWRGRGCQWELRLV